MREFGEMIALRRMWLKISRVEVSPGYGEAWSPAPSDLKDPAAPCHSKISRFLRQVNFLESNAAKLLFAGDDVYSNFWELLHLEIKLFVASSFKLPSIGSIRSFSQHHPIHRFLGRGLITNRYPT
jgi:hypothetical protein